MMPISLPVKDSDICRYVRHVLSAAGCLGEDQEIDMNAIAQENLS